MIDLKTEYLGLNLKNPLVVSASPISSEVDSIRRLEDAGAAAVVLPSLFEEQLLGDQRELHKRTMTHTESFSEAQSFFPEVSEYRVGPEEYLSLIEKAKEAVRIPIIASLNAATVGSWVDFAKKIQRAGADALELNIYNVVTDPEITSSEIEDCYLEIINAVRETVSLPLALKLSPFFTNLASMAQRIDRTGVKGLVLFNRFYQPDIDLELLELKPDILFSTPQALRLPLRWIAILHERVNADLAATSGIHTAQDVVKMVMVGASVTMLCSVLLKRGISHLKQLEAELSRWLDEHEYVSIEQMKGSMSQKHCEDPSAFERAQYIRTLHSFRTPKI